MKHNTSKEHQPGQKTYEYITVTPSTANQGSRTRVATKENMHSPWKSQAAGRSFDDQFDLGGTTDRAPVRVVLEKT